MSTPDPGSSGSDSSERQIAAARVALLKQLSHRAFSHKSQWPSQLHNALVLSGITKPESLCDDDNLALILSTPAHEARAHTFPSPVLVYRDGENSYSVADLNGLFLATNAAVRAGAAQETRRLCQFINLSIAPEFETALVEVGLQSDEVWRAAAARLGRLFEEEFLIAGFAYVHYERIGVDAFLTDRVRLACTDSPAIRDFLIRAQQSRANADPIAERDISRSGLADWSTNDLLLYAGAYELGGLLNPPGSALDLMQRRLEAQDDDGAGLLNAVTSLVSLLRGEPDGSVSWLADLQQLAGHYIRVLECTFPGISQTMATDVAWTMANYLLTVNRLFVASPDVVETFPRMIDAVQEYRIYWQYAKPPRSASTAYALTLSNVPPVAVDVALRLREIVSRPSPPDQAFWPAVTAFLAYMMIAAATNETAEDGPLYRQLRDLASQWIAMVPDPSVSSGLREIQSSLNATATRATLLEAYRELPRRSTLRADASLQLILAGTKRGQLSIVDLLEVWRDEAWRAELSRADLDVIQAVVSVCLAALDPFTTDAGVSFCHLLAQLTLSLRDDAERFPVLASLLTVSSVRTNTTSAAERLVAQCRGTERISVIQSAAEFLESHAQTAPSWIAGRMRSVLASLAN